MMSLEPCHLVLDFRAIPGDARNQLRVMRLTNGLDEGCELLAAPRSRGDLELVRPAGERGSVTLRRSNLANSLATIGRLK